MRSKQGGSAGTTRGRGYGGRRALLMLAGIGLLLLVLGSAHVCTDHLHGPSASWDELTGEYWGGAGTGAGPPPQAPCSDCLTTVYAMSRGTESCDYFWGDEDWEVEDDLSRDKPEQWVLVIVAGSGGYATGDFDCMLQHGLFWNFYHRWWNVHGEDGTHSTTECVTLWRSPLDWTNCA